MYVDPNPKVWGPRLWKILHTITFKYPEKIDNSNSNADDIKIKNRVRKLFNDLTRNIPCSACRQSYKKFLSESPIEPHLHSRESLSLWLYKIHNRVNAKLRNEERIEFNRAMQQLDEYSRLHRVSPEKFRQMKDAMRRKIMMTGSDPSFEKVKRMYRDVSL